MLTDFTPGQVVLWRYKPSEEIPVRVVKLAAHKVYIRVLNHTEAPKQEHKHWQYIGRADDGVPLYAFHNPFPVSPETLRGGPAVTAELMEKIVLGDLPPLAGL